MVFKCWPMWPGFPQGMISDAMGFAVDYGEVRLAGPESCPDLWVTIQVDEKALQYFLVHAAHLSLPKGLRFEIRQRVPANYGRTKGIAWYHESGMTREPEWGKGEFPRYVEEGGYYVLAQLVAGEVLKS